MTPIVLPRDGRVDVYSAVMLQPSGLTFDIPATLTAPLSQSLTPGLELTLAVSREPGKPTELGPGDVLFRVDADGTTATGQIYDFTGIAIEKNCHSGTRDNLLAAWADRPDRDLLSITQATGLGVYEMMTCAQLAADPLQTMLAPYFEPCGELPPGTPFDEATKQSIERHVAEGRQVVFLFGPSIGFDPVTGHRRPVSHSAIAVRAADGSMSIRNQLNITNPETLRSLDASATTLDVPLATVDDPATGLRSFRVGEALAMVKKEEFERGHRPVAWPHVVLLCEKAAEVPDAGVPDAGPPPVTPPPDGVPPVCPPEPAPTVGFCPGHGGCPVGGAACPCPPGGEFCCQPGFCWARDVIACVQETCPAGAGRLAAGNCACASPDKTDRHPCQSGLVLRCRP
jgi:hypothetical protein